MYNNVILERGKTMKKLMILVLMIGMALPLFAEKLNLGDPSLVERFGMNILKDKIDLYDPDEFGLWVLQHDYSSKYQKVRNDEFELDDAKKWAFDKYKQKLEKVKPIDKNAEYHIYLGGVRFGKYDFKEKRFPLIGALEEGSYMQYKGKGKIVNYYNRSKLIFDNATSDVNFIPMEKAEAKKFLKSRKDKYGNVDRNLIAHYIYTLKNYEQINEFQPGRSLMTIKFEGELKSVEFMDKKRKKIIEKIEFANLDGNSTKVGVPN